MNAAEQAYSKIRKSILTNVLSPGQRLPEPLLVELTGVSRTPVREALVRLVNEGFVETAVNQGARVCTWTLETIDEAYTIRAELESLAAERAALKLTEEQLQTMSQAQAKLKAAVTDDNPELHNIFTEMNAVFHHTIFEAAYDPRFANPLKRLSQLPMVFRTLSLYDRDRLLQSSNHHDELLRAFRTRDSKLAGAIMKTHMLSAKAVVTAVLSEMR